MQTEEFLGRKLAKHLKASKGRGDSHAEPASASASAADDDEGEEVLGRQRRTGGAEPLDLEVIDDRDLYQHLLKVWVSLSIKRCAHGRCFKRWAEDVVRSYILRTDSSMQGYFRRSSIDGFIGSRSEPL